MILATFAPRAIVRLEEDVRVGLSRRGVACASRKTIFKLVTDVTGNPSFSQFHGDRNRGLWPRIDRATILAFLLFEQFRSPRRVAGKSDFPSQDVTTGCSFHVQLCASVFSRRLRSVDETTISGEINKTIAGITLTMEIMKYACK